MVVPAIGERFRQQLPVGPNLKYRSIEAFGNGRGECDVSSCIFGASHSCIDMGRIAIIIKSKHLKALCPYDLLLCSEKCAGHSQSV